MTRLTIVVATSAKVAETSARSVKTRLLAECLRAVDLEELAIAVLYLSGEIRQGRIGIAPSVFRKSIAWSMSSRRSAGAGRARSGRRHCGL